MNDFTTRLTIIVLTLTAVSCLTAVAQQVEPTSQNNPQLKQWLTQFPQADANKDGILTFSEAKVYYEKLQAERGQKPGGAAAGAIKPDVADEKYGPHERNVLDLWKAKSDKPTPLLVFIHGGGFMSGDKSQVPAPLIQAMTQAGISVASINYRLTKTDPYPAAMHDGARAIQHLRHKAAEWNIDPKRIAATGGSAGACMSLWLAFHDDLADPKSSDTVARQSSRLLCAGSIAGQSTLDWKTFHEWFGVSTLVEHPGLRPLFAASAADDLNAPRIRELMKDASPITHLTRDDPPVYLTYQTPDTPVTPQTNPNIWVHHPRLGIKLKEATDKLGVECHVEYPQGPGVDGYRDQVDFLVRKLKGS